MKRLSKFYKRAFSDHPCQKWWKKTRGTHRLPKTSLTKPSRTISSLGQSAWTRSNPIGIRSKLTWSSGPYRPFSCISRTSWFWTESSRLPISWFMIQNEILINTWFLTRKRFSILIFLKWLLETRSSVTTKGHFSLGLTTLVPDLGKGCSRDGSVHHCWM